MRNPSPGTVLFNIGGVAVLATLFGWTAYHFLHTDQASRCIARYPAGRQLAFDDQSGNPLTPIELQARAGARQWGLLKNARIVPPAEAASHASMQVNLADAGGNDAGRTGVGFAWQSVDLSKASSACLSYRVYMPDKFPFGARGYLPGIFSATDTALLNSDEPKSGFAARVGWTDGGDVGIDLRSPNERNWQASEYTAQWPKGRWVPVEQEVVLNTPGSNNGTLRMWVDGKLKIENREVEYRKDPATRLTGVVADIGYDRYPGAPGSLNVSPFVLQWQ